MFALTACSSSPLTDEPFVGTWTLSEHSLNYDLAKSKSMNLEVSISKENGFYIVDELMNGKSSIAQLKNDTAENQLVKCLTTYQISADKHILYSVYGNSSYSITYNDESQTIHCPFGVFKRQ